LFDNKSILLFTLISKANNLNFSIQKREREKNLLDAFRVQTKMNVFDLLLDDDDMNRSEREVIFEKNQVFFKITSIIFYNL
jgi:hypothetical protein